MAASDDEGFSMLELYLGKVTWPIAALVIAVIIAVGGFEIIEEVQDSSVKRDILNVCEDHDDAPKCVKEVKKELG